MIIKFHILTIFLLCITLTACEETAKDICDAASNCTYHCPDGTITDPHAPKCPINDRDLLPPSNDNVGMDNRK